MLRRVILVTQLLVVLHLGMYARDAQSTEKTHSPHGKLSIPCENCHTAQGWKPIRAVPEFDHHKTGFALRGLHSKLSCGECHTDLVFAKTGNQCQDCHADIHRRKNGAQCEIFDAVLGVSQSDG